MKKFVIATLSTVAFALPALADNHKDMDGEMEKSEAEMAMEQEVSALRAAQVFIAIDTDNDARISEAEWADWQGRSGSNTPLFNELDADEDGDMEFSEYFISVNN